MFPRYPVFPTTRHVQTADKPSICRSRLMIPALDSFNKTRAGTIAQKSAVAQFNLKGICFTLYSLSICVIAPEKSLQKEKKKKESKKKNHSEDEMNIIYFGRKDSHKDSRMESLMSGAR